MAETTATGPTPFWKCPACATPNPPAAYVTNCLGCGRDRPAQTSPVSKRERKARDGRPVEGSSRGRLLRVVTWGYGLAVLACLAGLHWLGDTWWGVTLLLFAPRWLFLGPLGLLAAAAWVRRCPALWGVQAAIAVVIVGPLMGLSAPVRRLWTPAPVGERVRVATFNVEMQPFWSAAVKEWARRERLDVICFQEGERRDEAVEALRASGWHVSSRRAVVSRFPIVAELPRYAEDWRSEGRYSSALERVRVRTPRGTEFVVASLHLPTIRPGLQRFLDTRETDGLTLHAAWWGREVSRVLAALAEAGDAPMLVGGDFNMPADDSTMAALRATFHFAFEEAGWGYGYTRPTRFPWVQIDHVLASPEWEVASCHVGEDLGSDHLPMVAEVVLPAAGLPTQGRRP